MKRRDFLSKSAITTALAASAAIPLAGQASPADLTDEFYEFRTYTLRGGGSVRVLGQFLEEALIPALNRNGVPAVGVFRETGGAEPPKVYLLIPYSSIQLFADMPSRLAADQVYQRTRLAYDTIPVNGQVYYRYDTYLMRAFEGFPKMQIPEKGERIFELRTYEGFSEDAVRRKVAMFNDGEIDIFKTTGLHGVFFGHLVAGPEMPALTYMLSFRNMEERDKNWQAFVDHPEWKRISQLPRYENTVSKIVRLFLQPMSYSQV